MKVAGVGGEEAMVWGLLLVGWLLLLALWCI
jgi:hypothetical protein